MSDVEEPYSSYWDTRVHIHLVQRGLEAVTEHLQKQAAWHDQSKFFDPELTILDQYAPVLAELEYGTSEYFEVLRQMKPGLDHHYAKNPHHPEHWRGGITDMPLVYLLEMLVDWWAAGKRHGCQVDLLESIRINQTRFGYGDELRRVLEATARWLLPLVDVEYRLAQAAKRVAPEAET